ncbi:FirrV-1-E1 [Feldmannia irregularis virus a]|uniref:FirrV-1-E1 n=1 Tax=Feldmannia irregularis virus a TaxID=231992 RepID=Q6XLW1_9PHYC|nr:FirrV-1-E1 [Feldmannia irregularis virus a]AAR26950.1 FirrV-1-E1 [Feldmannia irregularis virus a]
MTTTTPIVRYPMTSVDTLGTNAEGSSYHATATNVSIVSDATYGNVAYFSGDGTSRIDMNTIPTDVLSGSATRGVSFWVNFDEINGNYNVYTQGRASDGLGNFVHVKIGYQNTNVRVEYGVSNVHMWHTTTLLPDTWYMFAMTYDGSVSRTYWDGNLVVEDTTVPDTTAGLVNLGKNFLYGADFKGKMTDFRIYDFALSLENIQSLQADGPSLQIELGATVYPHFAQLTWADNDSNSSSTYDITVSENGGAEVTVASSVTGTEFSAYNLNDGSVYDFRLYSDGTVLGRNLGQATPVIDSTSLTSMSSVLSNDLSVFTSDVVSEIQPLMDSSFETNDRIKVRVSVHNSTTVSTTTFVKSGDSIPLNSNYILTPFVPNGSSGQFFNLEMSDSSTKTLEFDESNSTILIDGAAYSVGDTLVLDGKTCTLGSLS